MSFPNLFSKMYWLAPVCLFLLFGLLQPKIASSLLSNREESLSSFTQHTIKQKDINLRQYWEFREFYAQGSFISQPEGIPDPNPRLQTLARTLTSDFTPILSFHSSRLDSLGGYTSISGLPQSLITTQNKSLLHTSTVALLNQSENILLIFVKPVGEMKKANGFIQHEPDRDEKRGDYWLEVTIIKQK